LAESIFEPLEKIRRKIPAERIDLLKKRIETRGALLGYTEITEGNELTF
jgi:hypothetical protein